MLGSGLKVCVMMGEWVMVVCKPILEFSFGHKLNNHVLMNKCKPSNTGGSCSPPVTLLCLQHNRVRPSKGFLTPPSKNEAIKYSL